MWRSWKSEHLQESVLFQPSCDTGLGGKLSGVILVVLFIFIVYAQCIFKTCQIQGHMDLSLFSVLFLSLYFVGQNLLFEPQPAWQLLCDPQAVFKLIVILLPQSPQCQDYRCVPPGLTFAFCFERFVVLLLLKTEHFWAWRVGSVVKNLLRSTWVLFPAPIEAHHLTSVSTHAVHRHVCRQNVHSCLFVCIILFKKKTLQEFECLLVFRVVSKDLFTFLLSYGCFFCVCVSAYGGQTKASVSSPETELQMVVNIM